KTYQVALPLHPEYRTLPMVWYVPPLSPLVEEVTAAGFDGEDHRILLTAVSQMRIPIEYLAGLLTAGDEGLVERVLRKLCAMRSHMRSVRLEETPDTEIAAAVGMSGEELEKMYRLLAIAKFDDRYVIPTAQTMMPRGIMELEGHEEAAAALGIGAPDGCSISYEALRRARARSEAPDSPFMPQGTGRINLLTWDGDPADALPKRSSAGVS
ncbi:MAG: hypothetical protein Q4Q03_08645, partial [Bowdeniella nasicola]|nr:hypothetical protein [Bowdeniella nasicola]